LGKKFCQEGENLSKDLRLICESMGIRSYKGLVCYWGMEKKGVTKKKRGKKNFLLKHIASHPRRLHC
jgi:hypothetical protein